MDAPGVENERMMFTYKIVCDNGSISYIIAKSRTEAISIYAEEKGITAGWIKDHCIVKCEGRSNGVTVHLETGRVY